MLDGHDVTRCGHLSRCARAFMSASLRVAKYGSTGYRQPHVHTTVHQNRCTGGGTDGLAGGMERDPQIVTVTT